MGFVMRQVDDALVPAVICDSCGEDTTEGFVLWDVAGAGDDRALLIACGVDCLEDIISERGGAGEWVAVPLGAYLAGLVSRLGIDIAAVLEREQAAAATEHTRREGPE